MKRLLKYLGLFFITAVIWFAICNHFDIAEFDRGYWYANIGNAFMLHWYGFYKRTTA